MSSLRAMAARLTMLEDERAVLTTLYRYAHSLDRGDGPSGADCFTVGGLFEMRMQQDGPRTKLQGSAA